MTLRKIFVAVAAVAALGAAAIGAQAEASTRSSVSAQSDEQKALVDAAKAQGIVGEQADGYLGFRLPAQASPALRAAVQAVNDGRRDVYARSAASAGGGATADAAGARMFETQLFGRVAAGHWYRNAQGQWVQR